MNQIARPLPQPTDLSLPYWEAAARGQLMVQQCAACGCRQFYPRAYCIACMSEDIRWTACKGGGTIYTYTINQRAANAAMKDKVPYAVAVIDLDEGVRMLANIVDSPLEEIAIGKRVQVKFEKVSEEITLPQFRLERGA
jgi:uncharacterized OB-fold protein